MDDRDLQHPLVLPLSPGGVPEDLDDTLARVEQDRVRETASFVFRVPSEFVLTFLRASSRSARESVLRRAAGRPVCLLTYNKDRQEHVLLQVTPEGTRGTEHPIRSRRIICEEELRAVLDDARARCVFEAGHTFHFVTPAGMHVERFVRVADVIRSRDALDRLAFWLLPWIAASDAVLVDTWGIATLALHAMQNLGITIPFDSLPAHPQEDLAGTRAVLERLIRHPNAKRILLIISITGSGRLASTIGRMVEAFRERGLGLKTVSLYMLNPIASELPALCKLTDQSVAYSSQETCKLCEAQSTPLFLESDLYYVKSREEKPILLNHGVFATGKDFVAKHIGVHDSLRVHRQDRNDGRHHAFDVDVLTLLEEGGWANRFREAAQDLAAVAEVIVAPPHVAGNVLAGLARQVYPSARLVFSNDLRKTRLSAEDVTALDACQNLLIVDDVLNSGSRLEGFNRSLREDFRQPGFKTVSYLVCLARPRSEVELKQIVAGLTQKHPWTATVNCLERMYLPSWKKDQCPWCREAEFLMRVASVMAEPPKWLDARIACLASSEGLKDEPLLILPGSTCPTLGNGSPVAPEGWNSMQVMFTVACGLEAQRRRELDAERLAEQFPVTNVFSLENWTHRYTEGLLRATFMRCVRRSEWGERVQVELREQFSKLATIPEQDFVRGEILCALGRNSVRAFSRELFDKLFANSLGGAHPYFARALGLDA